MLGTGNGGIQKKKEAYLLQCPVFTLNTQEIGTSLTLRRLQWPPKSPAIFEALCCNFVRHAHNHPQWKEPEEEEVKLAWWDNTQQGHVCHVSMKRILQKFEIRFDSHRLPPAQRPHEFWLCLHRFQAWKEANRNLYYAL